MGNLVIVDLSVGAGLSPRTAAAIAAAAQEAGAAAVRVLDGRPGVVLDATPVAAFLAARHPDIGWIVDAPTSHNAPYNLARRVLSLDRATGGRAGLALRVGAGDEVSDATAHALVDDPAERWSEYVEVVAALWQSFPVAALLGDQREGVFVESDDITPIDHDGSYYRVAGPLDGPASVQGRPVLLADDVDVLGWDRVARVADLVSLPATRVEGAATALADALDRIGRPRDQVALVGRVELSVPTHPGSERDAADRLLDWQRSHGLDGVELVAGGEREADLTRAVVALLGATRRDTLRASLGLADAIEVAA